MGAWTVSIWIRIGTDAGHLWLRWWTFGFHKMREISWTENRLASQGHCSMEWVSNMSWGRGRGRGCSFGGSKAAWTWVKLTTRLYCVTCKSEWGVCSPVCVHNMHRDSFALGFTSHRIMGAGVGYTLHLPGYGLTVRGSNLRRSTRFFYSLKRPDRLWNPPIFYTLGTGILYCG